MPSPIVGDLRTRPRLTIVLAAGSLAALTTTAAADVHLRYRDANGQPAADVYVHDGQVRMERRNDGVATLVDARSGGMTLIDHARRAHIHRHGP